MPAIWAIQDGQTFPLSAFTGADTPTPSGIAFSTEHDASNVVLTLHCDDGSSYALIFDRNGLPQGPAVKTEAPATAAKSESSKPKTGAALR